MERVGILGGTFDPPHIGHLILAEYSAEALALDHLLFVPAADPPHKQDQAKTPIAHRLAMLERALADNPRFELSRVDVDRPGPHYTLDMVKIIRDQYDNPELFFIMGGDSLYDLPTWHQPEKIIEICQLAIIRRPFSEIDATMHDAIIPGLSQRLVIIDAPLLEISSTQIVHRLSQGKSVRYLVPEAVLDYIAAHNLYQTD
ncbi:MAG: nicotinate-nucleotide adenylyltransferase [Chloroflexi bacterium]|nr:MAG: nicotinic acid mononucleotide adenylyltransferase [Phototrophicales bacterium]RMF82497.1 MAG: nicotinate-nucleotide adenylyltransferase [Chloroflexota bacterium]